MASAMQSYERLALVLKRPELTSTEAVALTRKAISAIAWVGVVKKAVRLARKGDSRARDWLTKLLVGETVAALPPRLRPAGEVTELIRETVKMGRVRSPDPVTPVGPVPSE